MKIRVAFAFIISSFSTGCSHLSYLYQAGIGQWSIYNHERSLQEVVSDPRTPEKVKQRLKWIPEIKAFLEQELDVRATTNYTTYVDLKRPYVVWSLTIAEPYQLKLKEWAFPIVGSFPYLGFFQEKTAQAWAEEAEKQGYDVHVRGVSAYSTLGYLRDPLLSSMLTRKKNDLVNLIFHETAHGEIYLKGQGSFNEQVASYIGDYGEKLWIERHFGANSPEWQNWKDERDDRRRLGQLLREFAQELKEFYSNPEQRQVEIKSARFSAFRAKLIAEPWKGAWKNGGVERFAKKITNNASLLALLTYEDQQEVFERLDEACKFDLRKALALLKQFAKKYDAKEGLTPQEALVRKLEQGEFGC